MSESETIAAAPARENPTPRLWLALTAIYASLTLVALDGAIVNVALPTISRDFAASSAAAVTVATAYQLAVVVALLPLSALGESIGPRKVFVGGIAVFIAASALCAMSVSLPMLVGARFLQGLGGAGVMAIYAMVLRFTVPKDKLAAAIGWNAIAVALAGAAGPSVGAAILSAVGWPWLFAVNIPIGALAILAARALPRVPGTRRPVDLVSAGASAAMFAMFFTGAGEIFDRPALGLPLVAAALAALVALIRREHGREAPVVPVDLFSALTFRRTVLASACTFAAQVIANIALPFHFETAFHASVLQTGLWMSAWPLAIIAIASFSGTLAARVPASRLCSAGTLVLAIGLAILAALPARLGIPAVLAAVAFAGLGFGAFQPANNRLLLLSAPKARSGAAGGVQGTTRLFGQTLGATVMTALFQIAPGDAAPRLGLIVAAGFALVASAVGAINARAVEED